MDGISDPKDDLRRSLHEIPRVPDEIPRSLDEIPRSSNAEGSPVSFILARRGHRHPRRPGQPAWDFSSTREFGYNRELELSRSSDARAPAGQLRQSASADHSNPE